MKPSRDMPSEFACPGGHVRGACVPAVDENGHGHRPPAVGGQRPAGHGVTHDLAVIWQGAFSCNVSTFDSRVSAEGSHYKGPSIYNLAGSPLLHAQLLPTGC
jgi:hypothetical protein